jgi:hypothetical protein
MPQNHSSTDRVQQPRPVDDARSWRRMLRRPLVWLGALLTAAITAFAVTWATGLANNVAPHPGKSPKLEVDSVSISTPASGQRATLDLKLRNIGNQLAIITGVQLHILQFATLRHCEEQGDLTPTGKYHANMPMRAKIGDSIDVPISQQVAPDAADRFKVLLRLPADFPGTVYSYRVRLDLRYDNSAIQRGISDAIVFLPFVPRSDYFWTHQDATVGNPFPFLGDGAPGVSKCLINNAKALRSLLSLSGIRAPQANKIPAQLSFCCVVKESQ